MAASASYLSRKASWETKSSPIESPRGDQPLRKQQRFCSQSAKQSPQNNGNENHMTDKSKGWVNNYFFRYPFFSKLKAYFVILFIFN